MGDYIIIWRFNSDSFFDTDTYHRISRFETYEDAKKEAERIYEDQNQNVISEWYYDYKIAKIIDM
jgi:hypothetical protein